MAISKGTERLTCFDAWEAKQAVETVSTLADETKPAENSLVVVVPPPLLKNWAIIKDTSAMTDEETVFVSTQSNESVPCRAYGTASELTLMLRCMEKTTAIFITGDCHVASGFESYGDVTFRVDENKAQTRSFDASTDSAALGIWSGKRAIPLVKELFAGAKLTVRFTPFGMSPVEATFDVTGTELAVTDLRSACSW